MPMNDTYAAVEPARADIDQLAGPTVIEFGAPWCGFCQAAQPLLESAFTGCPEIRHIKVEDGKGRPLGRSFRVTLWPTLIFMRDGKEAARLVRPDDEAAIREALTKIVRAA